MQRTEVLYIESRLPTTNDPRRSAFIRSQSPTPLDREKNEMKPLVHFSADLLVRFGPGMTIAPMPAPQRRPTPVQLYSEEDIPTSPGLKNAHITKKYDVPYGVLGGAVEPRIERNWSLFRQGAFQRGFDKHVSQNSFRQLPYNSSYQLKPNHSRCHHKF